MATHDVLMSRTIADRQAGDTLAQKGKTESPVIASLAAPVKAAAPVVSESDDIAGIVAGMKEIQEILDTLTIIDNPRVRSMIFAGLDKEIGVLKVKSARLAK